MRELEKTEEYQIPIPVENAIIKSRIQILEKIASTLDVEEVLKRIVEAAVDLTRADEGSLLFLDEGSGELYMRAALGFGEEYARSFRLPVTGDSIAGRVILTGRPVLLDPAALAGEQIKIKTGYFASSVLNLPIKRGDKTHGVLGVYKSGKQHPFTHQHLLLLTPLADYAAIAIENARRYQDTKQLLADTYALFDIAGLFTETRDLDELLDLVASLTLGRLEPADRAVIHLLNPHTRRLEYRVRIPPLDNPAGTPSGFAIGEGVAGRVLQENRPINISNIGDDPAFISRGGTFGSLLVAPISWRSACIGTISVASPQPHAFTRRNERFLTSLANLAAIAIENAHLYEEQVRLYEESQGQLARVERRNRELNSLRDILGALQSTLSLPEVLAHVATGVVEGLNYRAVMLATIDEATQLLTVKELALEPLFAQTELREQAEKLAGQKLLGSSVSFQENQDNLGIQVCRNGAARVTQALGDLFQPILAADMSQTIQDLFHLKTFAVMPIKSESRLFGVLYAGTERTEIEGPHLEALQAFANQAALAINNARQFEYMHERLRRRVKELQSLQDIDRLISSTADFERMLHSILEVSLKLVDAECGNIALLDQKTGQLLPKACYPAESILAEQYQQGLTAWVARQRKTIRIQDLSRTAWRNVYRDIAVRSELAVPILVGEEVVGVINMGNATVGAFTEEDESLLDILATQTAVAIQMTRYYQELEKTRQRSYEAERLAAMSDMASNMVHNINNSIGAIRVLVQQIRFKANYGSLSPEFLAKKLESIEHSAERTLEMARNIRNPFQNLATELTDINKCIRSALQSFEPRPSTLELILELADNLPPVLATQQLEEVLRNLIKNAIQSMKGLGTLHISSKHTGQKLEVAVTDTGPGISHDLTETSVFNLGVSSKSDGLGYGLWWCKIYLNRVGGAIDLDQSLTSGCRFVISLPLERVTERN